MISIGNLNIDSRISSIEPNKNISLQHEQRSNEHRTCSSLHRKPTFDIPNVRRPKTIEMVSTSKFARGWSAD